MNQWQSADVRDDQLNTLWGFQTFTPILMFSLFTNKQSNTVPRLLTRQQLLLNFMPSTLHDTGCGIRTDTLCSDQNGRWTSGYWAQTQKYSSFLQSGCIFLMTWSLGETSLSDCLPWISLLGALGKYYVNLGVWSTLLYDCTAFVTIITFDASHCVESAASDIIMTLKTLAVMAHSIRFDSAQSPVCGREHKPYKPRRLEKHPPVMMKTTRQPQTLCECYSD